MAIPRRYKVTPNKDGKWSVWVDRGYTPVEEKRWFESELAAEIWVSEQQAKFGHAKKS